jgi:hypothetical protein
VVEQEFGGCAGDPEAERRRVGLANIEAQMVEPASRGGAVCPGEDDGTGWEAGHHHLEGKLDAAGEVFEGV